jgi:hypothetical protein
MSLIDTLINTVGALDNYNSMGSEQLSQVNALNQIAALAAGANVTATPTPVAGALAVAAGYQAFQSGCKVFLNDLTRIIHRAAWKCWRMQHNPLKSCMILVFKQDHHDHTELHPPWERLAVFYRGFQRSAASLSTSPSTAVN